VSVYCERVRVRECVHGRSQAYPCTAHGRHMTHTSDEDSIKNLHGRQVVQNVVFIADVVHQRRPPEMHIAQCKFS